MESPRIYRDWLQKEYEKPKEEPVFWRLGGYGLLENENGQWLMVRSAISGKFDFPGGGIEVEERVPEGIVREFYEETGYQVAVEGMPIYLGENNLYHIEAGQFQHALIIAYRVRLLSKQRDAEVVNTADGYEIIEMLWIDLAELTEDQVQPIHWPLVQLMRSGH